MVMVAWKCPRCLSTFNVVDKFKTSWKSRVAGSPTRCVVKDCGLLFNHYDNGNDAIRQEVLRDEVR